MNTSSGGAKFRKFQIILDSGSSSTIVIGKLTSKLKGKKPTEITTWETQVTKLTTSKKVNVDFFLPEFSETKIVSWKFHLDNQNNSRYNMILVIYLIHALVLDIKFSENIIFGGDVPYQGCSAPMVDLSNYEVKNP